MGFTGEKRQLYVTLSTDSDEISEGNNSGYVLLDNPGAQENYGTVIVGSSTGADTGVLTINTVSANNTNADKNVLVVAALYSNRGRLISLDTQKVTLSACGTTPIDFSLTEAESDGAAVAKCFLLDPDSGYIPLNSSGAFTLSS